MDKRFKPGLPQVSQGVWAPDSPSPCLYMVFTTDVCAHSLLCCLSSSLGRRICGGRDLSKYTAISSMPRTGDTS